MYSDSNSEPDAFLGDCFEPTVHERVYYLSQFDKYPRGVGNVCKVFFPNIIWKLIECPSGSKCWPESKIPNTTIKFLPERLNGRHPVKVARALSSPAEVSQEDLGRIYKTRSQLSDGTSFLYFNDIPIAGKTTEFC